MPLHKPILRGDCLDENKMPTGKRSSRYYRNPQHSRPNPQMRATPVGFVAVEDTERFELPVHIIAFFYFEVLPVLAGILARRLEKYMAAGTGNYKFIIAQFDDH